MNERDPITLQCSISTSGNPPIKWSWICGTHNLTTDVNSMETNSTLTFQADRRYNQKTCHCLATSSKLPYKRPSKKANITVFCMFIFVTTLAI